jgi:T-complex protein 1 subunit beta
MRITDNSRLADVAQEKMKSKVAAIASHGITCFVNRQLIYNYPESLLSEQGIMAIEHADFEGVERLALVTGGEIASTFDAPDKVKIGRCDLIEEIMIGEDKVRFPPSPSIYSSCSSPHTYSYLLIKLKVY